MERDTSWLDQCRQAILNTEEWQTISITIYQQLQNALAEDRAGFFSDLSPDEQLAYMGKIEERFVNLPSYPSFMKKLSGIVDQSIANVVDSSSDESSSSSRLQRILEYTSAAAASLLRSSSNSMATETFQRLKILKNIPLSSTLRRDVWRLCLSYPSIRSSFQEKFASSNGLLTEQELDIGSKCEAILIKSFPQLLGDHEFLSDMRTVLAFLDAESMPIHATAFYFIFPALFAYRRGPEKRSDALTDIVEHMAALERANYVLTLVDQQMFTTFVIRLDADLKAKDPELYKVIERVSIERRSVGSSASGKLSSYSAGIRSYAVVSGLEDALDELCQYNFIRVCSIPVMMYVWDQLILSRWEALPRLSVVFLVCLRKPLLKCTSALAFCQVISRLGPHLQLGSLQRSMTVLYSIQRPHSLFDGPGTIFSATAFPGNKVEGFNLSGLGKFDDEYEQHQSRIEDIMKLWKKRSRQLAYWVMFIRARSIIHATASPDKPIT